MQAEAASAPAGIRAERSSVVAALRQAAAATGSDFHYLLGTAMRESGLRSDARAGTSSATGLFQFIDQTWLGLVKDHGANHGLAQAASSITKGHDGRYRTGNKEAILALRKDPTIAALMAGEHARQTGATLQSVLGRPPCGGELYAAHFLGPESACKLIKLAENDPGISAASQFPAAAAANKSVFYRADGSARSVKEVYDWALRQPGASGTVRFAPPPPPEAVVLPQSPAVMMATRDDEMQMLLMSVMNWQPRNYFTGESFGSGATTLSMGPGLLSLLSEARES